MIIDDLNVAEIIAVYSETYAVLVINPDAVLSRPVAGEPFQTVPGRNTQILQTSCIVDHDQLAKRRSLHGQREFGGKDLMVDLFRLPVRKALYHGSIIPDLRVYVKWVFQRDAVPPCQKKKL